MSYRSSKSHTGSASPFAPPVLPSVLFPRAHQQDITQVEAAEAGHQAIAGIGHGMRADGSRALAEEANERSRQLALQGEPGIRLAHGRTQRVELVVVHSSAN